jgi:hypothetical protein
MHVSLKAAALSLEPRAWPKALELERLSPAVWLTALPQ